MILCGFFSVNEILKPTNVQFYLYNRTEKEPEDNITDSEREADEDEEENEDSEPTLLHPSPPFSTNQPQIRDSLAPLIKKVRQTVRIFKKSPVKMDSLRDSLAADPEITVTSLILDCKTRWSSMSDMIERYLVLAPHVHKLMLKEFNEPDLVLSKTEMTLLQNAFDALRAVKWASEMLCSQTVDLAGSDAIIRFLENRLTELSCPIADGLLESLQVRYHDRKNSQLLGVVKFLENPNQPKDVQKQYKLPSRTSVAEFLKEEHSRLYPDTPVEEPEETTEPSSSSPKKVTGDKNKKDLNKAFELFLSSQKASTPTPAADVWSKKLELFSKSGERSPSLSQMYDALKTVPPTSVEAERVFSVTGQFYSEIRSRMSATTVDMLVFVKYFLLRSQ